MSGALAAAGLGLFVLTLLLLGAAVTAALLGPRGVGGMEACGLVVSLGAGSLALALFLSAILGMRPSPASLAVLAGLGAGALAFLYRRGAVPRVRLPSPDGRGPRRAWLVLLAALLFPSLSTVGADAVLFPLYDWDGFAIWGLKAKVIFLTGLDPRPPYFSAPALSFSHQDYPLLVPLLMAGVWGGLGHVDDRLGKLPMLLLYAAFLCLLYGGLRRWLERGPALALTVIGGSLPVLLGVAGTGNADLALTTFYCGSVCYLLRGLFDPDRRALLVSACFTAFLAFTKNEGLALAALHVLLAGVLALRRPRREGWRAWLLFTGTVLLLLAPWLLWSRALPDTHEGYLARLTPANLAQGLHRLGPVLRELGRQGLELERWGGLWLLLAGAGVLGWRAFGRGPVRAAWALFAGQLGVYVLAFLVTPWDLEVLFAASTERLLLHVIPVALLLIGMHLSAAAPALADPGEAARGP